MVASIRLWEDDQSYSVNIFNGTQYDDLRTVCLLLHHPSLAILIESLRFAIAVLC